MCLCNGGVCLCLYSSVLVAVEELCQWRCTCTRSSGV